MSQYIIIGGDGKEYGPVSAQDVREWVRTGRANGDTRIKPEEAEDWKQLRNLPEFEGDLASGSTPTPIAVDSAFAQTKVRGPATFMLVLGIVSLVLVPLSILYQFTQGQDAYNDLPPELREFFLQFSGVASLVSNAVSFIANILIVIGALKMKKLESFGLAMTASILCIICDCGCCCLGIGAGIWSIVVLCNAQVKAAFH